MNKPTKKEPVENNRLESALAALGKNIARWTDKGDQLMTAIPGLSLFRRDGPSPPMSIMYEPRILSLIIKLSKKEGSWNG